LARGGGAEAAVADADLEHAATRAGVAAERGQAARARLLARRSGVRRVVERIVRRRVGAHLATYRRAAVVFVEPIEILALTASAGAHYVARNLRPAPHLGRETDRAAAR